MRGVFKGCINNAKFSDITLVIGSSISTGSSIVSFKQKRTGGWDKSPVPARNTIFTAAPQKSIPSSMVIYSHKIFLALKIRIFFQTILERAIDTNMVLTQERHSNNYEGNEYLRMWRFLVEWMYTDQLDVQKLKKEQIEDLSSLASEFEVFSLCFALSEYLNETEFVWNPLEKYSNPTATTTNTRASTTNTSNTPNTTTSRDVESDDDEVSDDNNQDEDSSPFDSEDEDTETYNSEQVQENGYDDHVVNLF